MEQCSYENLLETMKCEYESMAGYVPSGVSDIGIRMQVLAKELEKLWIAAKSCEKQVFPNTADAQYLDMHSQLRGLKRKQGSKAAGQVIFYRENNAISNILISAGTVVSTSGMNPIRFITCEDVEIKIGQKEVTASAVCDSIGVIGNVSAKAINVIVTPVSGVAGVINRKMFGSGTEKETDNQLRQRLLQNYRMVDNGTNSAFYYHKVMDFEGITSANVIPRVNGVGTVAVILDSYNTSIDPKTLENIKKELDFAKEINVDITVKEATKQNVNVQIELSSAEGCSFAQAQEQCNGAIEEFFLGLGVAQPLYLASLISKIMEKPQIANCKIISPIKDIRPTATQVLRKGTVLITEMEVV